MFGLICYTGVGYAGFVVVSGGGSCMNSDKGSGQV